MKHDRLFKELLTSFFYEFLELFFADLAQLINRSHPPIFLDKESSYGSSRQAHWNSSGSVRGQLDLKKLSHLQPVLTRPS